MQLELYLAGLAMAAGDVTALKNELKAKGGTDTDWEFLLMRV